MKPLLKKYEGGKHDWKFFKIFIAYMTDDRREAFNQVNVLETSLSYVPVMEKLKTTLKKN